MILFDDRTLVGYILLSVIVVTIAILSCRRFKEKREGFETGLNSAGKQLDCVTMEKSIGRSAPSCGLDMSNATKPVIVKDLYAKGSVRAKGGFLADKFRFGGDKSSLEHNGTGGIDMYTEKLFDIHESDRRQRAFRFDAENREFCIGKTCVGEKNLDTTEMKEKLDRVQKQIETLKDTSRQADIQAEDRMKDIQGKLSAEFETRFRSLRARVSHNTRNNDLLTARLETQVNSVRTQLETGRGNRRRLEAELERINKEVENRRHASTVKKMEDVQADIEVLRAQVLEVSRQEGPRGPKGDDGPRGNDGPRGRDGSTTFKNRNGTSHISHPDGNTYIRGPLRVDKGGLRVRGGDLDLCRGNRCGNHDGGRLRTYYSGNSTHLSLEEYDDNVSYENTSQQRQGGTHKERERGRVHQEWTR